MPYRIELTQYPPGFRIAKKGLTQEQYAGAISELLYLLA